jgi:signal transduction histidine kinase/ActR/RegA family two-component response regulator
MRLAGRVYAAVFLTLAASLAVFGGLQAREQSLGYRLKAGQEALSGATYISKLVEHDLVVGDYAAIDQSVTSVMQLSDILRVQVAEPDGTVLSDVFRQEDGLPVSTLMPSPPSIPVPSDNVAPIRWEGDRIVVFRPVGEERPLAWIKVSYGTAPLVAMQRSLALRTLMLGSASALLSLGVLFLVLRRPIGAIRTLSAFARNLSGRPGEQVGLPPSPVEIEQLAAALNAASAELRDKESLQSQLLHAQKMEAVGHLAGGIAHDFNNILTAIIGYAHLISTRLSADDTAREGLEQILNSANRAAVLTQSLLAFSRKQRVEMRFVDLNASVRDIAKILRRILGEDVELRLDLASEPLPVFADPGQLGQLLVNLATNARDAMPDGGTFVLETREVSPPAGKAGRWIELTAADAGSGIDPMLLEHVFEPFFTTKEVGKGTGLGLAIVHGVTTLHGGTVSAENAPGGGALFRIRLPMAEGAAVSTDEPCAEAPPPRGDGTILLTEDERDVRNVIRLTLEEAGYRVLEASNGDEALAVLASPGSEAVRLLVSDVIMPGMNGLELIERAHKVAPGLPALLMSGYSADFVERKGGLPPGVLLLQKPASSSALLRAVARSIDETGRATRSA